MSTGPFVHLGGETVVDVRELVAILDARSLQRSVEGRGLIARAAAAGRLADPDLLASARAIVVTTTRLYPTPVSAAAVAGRVGYRGLPRRPGTAAR